MRPQIPVFPSHFGWPKKILAALLFSMLLHGLWRHSLPHFLQAFFLLLIYLPMFFTILGRNWIYVGGNLKNWGIYRFETIENFEVCEVSAHETQISLQLRREKSATVKFEIESTRILPRFLAEMQRREVEEKAPEPERFAAPETALDLFSAPFETPEAEREALYQILGRKPKF